MNKQNLLTLTLIISGLALNPVMADAVVNTVASTQTINHSISSSISSLLYNRGLEEETANELAANIVDEEDEIFLAMLLQTLDAKNIVSHNDVLEYLSMAALHKQKIDFKSYDHLVGMVSKIKKSTLDKNTLEQLSYLAKMNKMNKQLFV
jgi:hypothetical protein